MLYYCDSILRTTPGRRWWSARRVWCGRGSRLVAPSAPGPASYRCSYSNCLCTEASLEYRLRLLGTDDTGEAEFTLLGIVARDIIGLSPQQIILNNRPTNVPVLNLALAAG